MRNALYQGNATELINRLAEKEAFVEATEHSIPANHMKDRYLVLRFVAFYLWQQHVTIDPDTDGPLDYRSNVEDFLGKTMRFLNRLDRKTVCSKSWTPDLPVPWNLPYGCFRQVASGCLRHPVRNDR